MWNYPRRRSFWLTVSRGALLGAYLAGGVSSVNLDSKFHFMASACLVSRVSVKAAPLGGPALLHFTGGRGATGSCSGVQQQISSFYNITLCPKDGLETILGGTRSESWKIAHTSVCSLSKTSGGCRSLMGSRTAQAASFFARK
jgi:hypothetical protein